MRGEGKQKLQGAGGEWAAAVGSWQWRPAGGRGNGRLWEEELDGAEGKGPPDHPPTTAFPDLIVGQEGFKTTLQIANSVLGKL